MDGPRLQAFLDAAELASGVLGHEALRPGWDEPSALEGFSVGGLAGHLYGSVRRLEAALDEPIPASPTLAGVAAFYGPNRVDEAADLTQGLHPLIRQEGERRARYGAGELASVAIEVFVELARARAGDLDVIRAFTRGERSGTDVLRVL